ncbi:MAG: 2Fe-2S iron-sulfur cluster binding domain-containing protein, partial [Chloroflexi bacterium]|nr:2Fe-2S iron-sulfur cluster binding domain-containing protein [Chloroflexota bacterium]
PPPGIAGTRCARAPDPHRDFRGNPGADTWHRGRSGWSSQFGSLLAFAEACAVPTRWSCRTGVCHTCESRLLAGHVSYAPEPLEPPVAGELLICCAVPVEDIVLDL